MENLDFLKQILMSDAEYWIVAKRTYSRQYFETDRGKDQILFISIPQGIKRGLKYEDIRLKDAESLNDCYCDYNIDISEDYAPFQLGQSFHNIYKGYPINRDIKQFVIDALHLKSNDLYDYKKLIKE